MKICFWNLFQIGDMYFASYFVQRIYQLNPEYDIYFQGKAGDVFYGDVPRLATSDLFFLNTEFRSSDGWPKKKHMILNDILYVNTWCAALGHRETDLDIECWFSLISELNQAYDLCLKLDDDLLSNYRIKTFEIPTKPVVQPAGDWFIFNYTPKSVSGANHYVERLQQFIRLNHKNNTIYLAEYDQSLDGLENIVMIASEKTRSCANLVVMWQLAQHCKNIMLLPSGSSLTFLHQLKHIKSNLYMLGHQSITDNVNHAIKVLYGAQVQTITNLPLVSETDAI